MGYIVSKFAPSLSTSKSLGKYRGKKAIFYSSDDEIVSLRNVQKNIEAISRAGRLKDLTLISGPGEHAIPITGIKASPEKFSRQEIQKIGEKLRILLDEKTKYEQIIREHKETLKELDEGIGVIQVIIKKNAEELKSLTPDQQQKSPKILEIFNENIKKNELMLAQGVNKRSELLLKMKKFQSELEKTDSNIGELKIVMDDLYGESKVAPTGQIQLEHFLNKAGLMEQVIPVRAQTIHPGS